MKSATVVLTVLTLLFSLACNRAGMNGPDGELASSSKPAGGGSGGAGTLTASQDLESSGAVSDISLSRAESQSAPIPTERRIIRNANLTVEIGAPADGARRIASIAESRGGFVVTSESRQQGGSGSVKPFEVVTVELRVPAAQFDAVVGEIRSIAGNITEEKITGQDVTEEYIDLEARIRAQKGLETQFLQIMKSARKVSDALEVQRELANVRAEIERLDGRRRFLENQTSLSTIKILLRPPSPLVNTIGFFQSIRSALGDGIDAAAAIVLVLVRVVFALIPVLLLFVLPGAVLVRFAVRRFRRRSELA